MDITQVQSMLDNSTSNYSNIDAFVSNNYDIDDIIQDYNLTHPAIQKSVNLMSTAQQKELMLRGRTIQKRLGLEGFTTYPGIELDDSDSGLLKDEQGNDLVGVRIVGDKTHSIDAIDSLVLKEGESKSPYARQLQAKLVSDLTGKPIEELTAEDYANVKNWDYQNTVNSYTGNGFVDYERDKVYNQYKPTTVPVAIKKLGEDMYGRWLVETANPTTGEHVSFNQSNNPLRNARNDLKGFDIYKIKDNKVNRGQQQRDEYYERFSDPRYFRDYYDTDGNIGELLDAVKSGGLQSFARVAKYFSDDPIYKALSDSATGQDVADYMTGVKKSTRDLQELNRAAGDKAFKDGDYIEAFMNYAKNGPISIADSAVSMGLLMIPYVGLGIHALDLTLGQIEDYKANNNGETPDVGTMAAMYLGQLILAVPEKILLKTGVVNVLKKTIVSSVKKSGAISQGLKNVLLAFFGEFGQETLQESFDVLGSKKGGFNFKERGIAGVLEDYKDVILDEGVRAGLQGAISGGMLAGTGNIAVTPIRINRDIKEKKANTELKNTLNTTNAIGQTLKPEQITHSNELITRIKNTKTFEELDNIRKTDVDLTTSKDVLRELVKRKNEFDIQSIKDGKTIDGRTNQEVFDEAVVLFNSDPINYNLKDEVKVERLEKIGKALGLTKEQIKKSMEEVDNDIAYGVHKENIGYTVYESLLNDIDDKLKDTKLSEDRKTDLETQRTKLQSNLANLYDVLDFKADTITNAVNQLTNSKAVVNSMVAKFKDGGSFRVQRDKIGPVIKLMEGNFVHLKKLHGLLSKHKIDEIRTKSKDFILPNVDTLEAKENAFRLAIDKLNTRRTNALTIQDRTNILKRVLGNDGTIPGTLSVTNITRLLHALSKNDFNPSNAVRLTVQNSLNKEHLKQVFEYVSKKNNSEKNRKSMDVLKSIIKDKEIVSDTKEKIKQKRDSVVKRAIEAKTRYNKQAIDDTNTLKDLQTLQSKMYDVAKYLENIFTVNKDDTEVKELLKYYRDLMIEIKSKYQTFKNTGTPNGKPKSTTSNNTGQGNTKTNEEVKDNKGNKEGDKKDSKPTKTSETGLDEQGNLIGYNRIINDDDTSINRINVNEVARLLGVQVPSDTDSYTTIESKILNVIKDVQFTPYTFKILSDWLITNYGPTTNLPNLLSNFMYKKQKEVRKQERKTLVELRKEARDSYNNNPIVQLLKKGSVNLKDTLKDFDKLSLQPIRKAFPKFFNNKSTRGLDDFLDEEGFYKDDIHAESNFIEQAGFIGTLKDYVNNYVQKVLDYAEEEEINYILGQNNEFDNDQIMIDEIFGPSGTSTVEIRDENQLENIDPSIPMDQGEIVDSGDSSIVDASTGEDTRTLIQKTIDNIKVWQKRLFNHAIKDWFISKALQSIYIPPDNHGYDLEKLLAVSETAESVFAIGPIDVSKVGDKDTRELLTKVIEDFNKLNPLGANYQDNTKSSDTILESYFLRKDEETGKTILDSFPAFTLLFDITKHTHKTRDKKTGKLIDTPYLSLKVKPNIALALDFSIREWLTNSSMNDLFNPKDNNTLIDNFKILSKDDEAFTEKQDAENYNNKVTQLREVLNKYGIPRSTVITMLGKKIMKNLGLVLNTKTGVVGFDELMLANLATIALRYATDSLGIFEQTKFEPPTDTKHVIKHPTWFIKVKDQKAINQAIHTFKDTIKNNQITKLGLSSVFKLEENSTDTITKNPTIVKELPIPGTNGLLDVDPELVDNFNTLNNVPYSLNKGLLEEDIIPNIEAMLQRVGYIPEDSDKFKALSYDKRHKQKSINADIIKQFDNLITTNARSTNITEWYFSWYQMVNGRVGQQPTDINSQQQKAVTRFAILPEKLAKKFDPKNESHMNVLYYAIAQAFNTVLTDEAIVELGKKLVALDHKELAQLKYDLINEEEQVFSEKYKKRYGIKGVENYGHALVVLRHLKSMLDNPGKSFMAVLPIEQDSLTSGYVLRRLLFPPDTTGKDNVDNTSEKFGILNETMSMNDKKQQPNFLDTYKTMAKSTLTRLPTLEELKESVLPHYEKSYYNRYILTETYKKLLNFLPKADTTISDSGETIVTITSALRTLLKPPTTERGYTAGRKTIIRGNAETLSNDLIDTYFEALYSIENKIKLTEKQQSVVDTFKYLDQFYTKKDGTPIKGGLALALSKESMYNIWLKLPSLNEGKSTDNMLLNKFLYAVFAPTYGEAINSALEELGYDSKFSTAMLDIFNDMINIFSSKFEEGMTAIRNKPENKGTVPVTEYNKLIEELFNVMPTLKLAYYSFNQDSESKTLLVMGSEKVVDEKSKVKNYYNTMKDGKIGITSDISYANIRRFLEAGKAGAVLPIHFMESMIMDFMIQAYGTEIVPIFDAFITSAIGHQEKTRFMNGVMFLLCRDTDILGDLANKYIDVIEAAGINPNTRQIYSKFKQEDAPNVTEFLLDLGKLIDENSRNKGSYYSKTYFVNNIPGFGTESGITIEPNYTLEDLMAEFSFKELLKNKKIKDRLDDTFQSDPTKIVFKSELEQLSRDGLDTSEKVVNMATKLRDMDRIKPISDKHFNYLTGLLSKINLKAVKDLVINVADADFNAGQLLSNDNINIGLDDLSDLDSVSKANPLSFKSAPEIYTHEIIHTVFRFALKNWETLGLTPRHKTTLFKIQKQAMSIVTVEDLMPDQGTYDTNLEKVYRKEAQERWNSMFINKTKADQENLRSLHEFVAYAMSNEKIIDKLSKDTSRFERRTTEGKIYLLDRLVQVFLAVLDAVTGKGEFKGILKTLKPIAKGQLYYKQQNTLFEELNVLFNRMNGINQSSILKLSNGPYKLLEGTFASIGLAIRTLNNITKKPLNKVKVWADKTPFTKFDDKEIDKLLENRSLGNYVKFYSNMAALILFSKKRRDVFFTTLAVLTGMSQQNTFFTLMRDIQEPSLEFAELESLKALTRSIERTSKEMENNIKFLLQDAFRDNKGKLIGLNDLQQKSLSEGVLEVDLQVLAKYKDGKLTNIDELIEYLENPVKVQNEINNLEKTITDLDKKNSNYYIKQSMALGHFMVTGEAISGINLNAENIARGIGTGLTIDPSKDIINAIDRLVTFYALLETNEDTKLVTASLAKQSNKGFSNLLQTHRHFIQQSLTDDTINKVHIQKGYTRSLYDETVSMRVAPLKNEEEMYQKGFKLVTGMRDNPYTKQSGLGLYIQTWSNPQRIDGSSFIIPGQHAFGTSLMESAFQIAQDLPGTVDVEEVKNIMNIMKKEADKDVKDMLDRMKRDKNLTVKQMLKSSRGYVPIVSPTGGFSNYRVVMSKNSKIKYLGMKQNAFESLGKMYAQKTLKIEAKTANNRIVKFLENDMLTNMETIGRLSPDYKNFIRLQENSDNEFLRKAWKSIPSELMARIKWYDKNKDGFWVRDEWLRDIFGTPSMSLIDTKIIDKNTGYVEKKAILIAEHIMKYVTYAAKQVIVLKLPRVLVANLISNVNFSSSMGFNPVQVIKKHSENAHSLREYLNDKKTLDRILMKQKLHTATSNEIKSISYYETKLLHNPVEPLMKKGMYQSIMEDLSIKELESMGKVNKAITNYLKNKKIPKSLRKAYSLLYLTEETPYFRFMKQVTEYSDFVARASHYQLVLERAEKEKLANGKINPDYVKKYTNTGKLTKEWKKLETDTTNMVWSAFINYDRPQATPIQYLNDIGLMWFTKYATRIQHVVIKGFTNAPVSTLMFLFAHSKVMDSGILGSSMYDYLPGSYNPSVLLNDPLTSLYIATIPPPIQYLLD